MNKRKLTKEEFETYFDISNWYSKEHRQELWEIYTYGSEQTRKKCDELNTFWFLNYELNMAFVEVKHAILECLSPIWWPILKYLDNKIKKIINND